MVGIFSDIHSLPGSFFVAIEHLIFPYIMLIYVQVANDAYGRWSLKYPLVRKRRAAWLQRFADATRELEARLLPLLSHGASGEITAVHELTTFCEQTANELVPLAFPTSWLT